MPGRLRLALSRTTVVPYWMLVVILASMLGTTGLLIYNSTHVPVRVVPKTIEARLSPAPQPSLPSPGEVGTIQAQVAQISALHKQVDQVSAGLAEAQRDSSSLHQLTQQQSQDLAQTQSALQTVQQQRQAEVQDLQGRLASLEQQIDAIEQMADKMRKVVGLPDGNAVGGGSSSVPATKPGQDQAASIRTEMAQATTRVDGIRASLDAINERAQERLAAVAKSDAADGQIPADQLAFASYVPRGAPVNGTISQPFGPTDLALEPAFDGHAHFHTGMDIAVPEGTPVKATGPGIVVVAGWSGGYGNLIVIDHGHGISTYYGHNSQLNVSVGDHVDAGQTIGLAGTTGNSTGPHVHYEVRINDVPVDPSPYMQLGQ